MKDRRSSWRALDEVKNYKHFTNRKTYGNYSG